MALRAGDWMALLKSGGKFGRALPCPRPLGPHLLQTALA